MTTPFLMMSNYEQAGKYIETSTNSAGIAAEKLAVYQDSLAAKSAKVSAAFESLSMTMINSGLVGAFYDMSAAILNMGAGLPDVVVNIGEPIKTDELSKEELAILPKIVEEKVGELMKEIL